MENLYWDEDGGDGRPSSMAVLLQWLSDPKNAKCWWESSNERNTTRRVAVVDEIYGSLLVHGIKHRSRGSVDVKVLELMHSFEKVDHWLQRKGIYYLDRNSRAERKVLKACPYYRELSRLLQSSRPVGVVISHGHSIDAASFRTVNDALEYFDNDDVTTYNIGFKRLLNNDNGETTRKEVNGTKIDIYDAGQRRLLEAEKAVRHELFKLELQAKRDEAICVRVKSRKELLELGVTIEEVNRLMPL
ncbi:hypothetical protein PPTG_00891 [Phytophthora nicotianae INRA-310]|uniref:Uncharacterized protein n=1 Tax=Phytophthora nicotianae (strain INRA-310) TaxID=761204 RepID=W2RGX3_PHYN3|nr:hypothetical protein PPTG_00891 [Phytophthora nicotianae INRA-310]ETN24667.1 hypothetical protein PPTG_00891 [Phytophthora nicotianae INRA-310]